MTINGERARERTYRVKSEVCQKKTNDKWSSGKDFMKLTETTNLKERRNKPSDIGE